MTRPWFIVLAITFLSSPSYATCTVTDDAQQTIALSHPAQRIISLAPDITETLFAIGAGGRVVGVMQGSDYPAAAKTLPQVGSYAGLDLEKILSLHPDLIIVWGNTFARQIGALRNLHIPIYVSAPQQLTDIPATMHKLGCLAGTEKIADQKAQAFMQGLSILSKRYQMQKPIRVFYQIGAYSLITINKDSWINQVITLCGGRNIFAQLQSSVPEVSWEAVVLANPEVIISDIYIDNWQQRWQKWSEISAVQRHLLFSVDPNLIERAGPRLLQGAQILCELVKKGRK